MQEWWKKNIHGWSHWDQRHLPIKDMDKWQGSSSSFRRVGSTWGGKTNKLNTGKSLCRGDKDIPYTLEAVGKCSRVITHRQCAAHAGLVVHSISHGCKLSSSLSLSGVITGVVVKLEDAQRERVQDAETHFLDRWISTEHMQSQWETWECMTHCRQRRDQ